MCLFVDMQTELYICLKPKLFLKKAILKKPKSKIVEINTTQTSSGQSICAYLEISELKKLLPDQISNVIFGKGAVIISGNFIDNIFTGTIEIKDGNLIVLNSYNIIKNLKANFTCNLKNKSLSIANVFIQLDKGTITSSNAIIELNDKNEIGFMHLSILINNCFLFCNNMFGIVSGKILINKQAEASNISGKIILDDAKIRNNVFSSEFN